MSRDLPINVNGTTDDRFIDFIVLYGHIIDNKIENIAAKMF